MAVPRILPNCLVPVVCLALVAAVHRTCAAQIDVEFSNFAVGETFPNSSLPRTITADGVDIELSKFNNSLGANGRIVDVPRFGEANNALFLAANLRAEIVLPAISTGGFFFFINQGGTNLLEINGQALDFTHSALSGSDFETLGGVEIHSSPLTGSYRSVKLDGLIRTLAFIGQELTIDSVVLGIGLPGDHNLDGAVDAADYVMWRKSGGTLAEYNTWRTNFGATTGSGSAAAVDPATTPAVPEPASALLLLLGAAASSRGRSMASRARSTPLASEMLVTWRAPSRCQSPTFGHRARPKIVAEIACRFC